jgi:hypothetical protein
MSLEAMEDLEEIKKLHQKKNAALNAAQKHQERINKTALGRPGMADGAETNRCIPGF